MLLLKTQQIATSKHIIPNSKTVAENSKASFEY
jgi:hypothetical protein